ncbi:ABC transporter substrate-binding protein [Azospirillum sp. RWY-5-1]|nr:ABC transporter substrate-binding protein [Azospirillum oleiclasticum]NYZ13872.1 ABC transporter substrate-binding protein [Azospirillum oleiclasticum]
MGISRRAFLAGSATVAGAAAIAAPAIAQGRKNVLRYIPPSNLAGIDPVLTSGAPVRNHGYQIYDTLFGMDRRFEVRPQMAEGAEQSSDGLTWTIRLRDGLRFHDGEKVLARDCVASLRRWGARDPLGQTIFNLTDELRAVDDRTLEFRLKSRFGLLTKGLAKIGGPAPFIMPERIAQTDPNVAIKEAIGSGPFRFLADEWVPGSRAVYAKFDGYLPRNEAPDCTSGGKIVHIERLEWHVIPDAATATAALQRGEVDWYSQPDLTLLPLLKQDQDVIVEAFDDLGYMTILRFNHLQPPFDRLEMRRAIQMAVNQVDYLQAQVGMPDLYKECRSAFFCGTTMSTGTGSEVMTANFEKAKALLKSSYNGEKVAILTATDLSWLHAASLVTEDLLKRMGVNVELQAMDLGTFFKRRTSMEPVDKGGWSIFHTGTAVTDIMDPATHLALRGNGRQGWPGWPTDPVMEQLRTDWMAASGPEQDAITRKVEARAFAAVPFVPLGQFQTPSARRRTVTGMLKAPLPLAWNIRVA